MNRAALLTIAFMPGMLVVGCGGSSSSSRRSTTAAAVSTTTAPVATSTPLVDVHGELVLVPALTGGGALAFQADGAAAAREITDPSALVAAGLHEGFTLVLSGDGFTNAAGRTGLVDAVRVSAFQKDDLVTTGRIVAGVAGTTFNDDAGGAYVASGPHAAAFLTSRFDRPLRVTGRVDTTQPHSSLGLPLIVTSFRPAVTVAWHHNMPLLGAETFSVDDLGETGAHRVEEGMVTGSGFQETRGAGRRLDPATLADLQAKVLAADLRSLPGAFMPPRLYPDHPSEAIRFADAQGDHDITVWAGASVPPALADLMQALRAVPATVARMRGIDQDYLSAISAPEVTAARDLQAWGSLLARHVGGRPFIPMVDFPRELAVGVFDGQRPTTGWSIEVKRVVKIGPHLHLEIVRTSPSGRILPNPTSPYHLIAIDLAGHTGDLYADGVRLP